MSKKKQAAVILGPDGRPVDVAAMRRAAEPKPELSVSVDGGSVLPDVTAFTLRMGTDFLSRYLYGSFIDTPVAPKPRSLKDAVADDVAALTADFDGAGGAEFPKPPTDLTGYRDAHASAAANCLHDDAVELLYGREWTCDACGRHIDRDEMRRARSKRPGLFGYFGFGG